MNEYEKKSLEATILFVDYFKEFDSMHRGNMEQLLLAFGIPKEIADALQKQKGYGSLTDWRHQLL